ncbi:MULTISPECIES: bifunctional DedA family/phosphatase PAP2 family protein [unclassified Pseudomonas]|uniref:bifunctional DedA family/phosphatase PAP2 family protein n=1 Tax=unclassified Pseudomonas TaxID=196821 RepID=UPI002AC91767|nr:MULTISPECIES: bifunctional DedA family/phosphatase PAP2 family protein [unclassified Pseudomonas]MEB0041080.1 bifunctional DedA family/phosphatase PAP2 family protein [Pseudomonas sp. MH10]MEB0076671.1 bifunctional DedA family/phosphatase PAP2 family protein [Pseudomonas sp. MH10out]MEB0090398.1 bifunctional DedA family/phosphatase PAP2 family protein [Pseudomonas sp. CCI4.2]MEB0100759.1 bifunctional DedA family/phosphatase PAP2 family protein [Pseudomonas sp. CCI3.2]MEB0120801.1 bifunction
MGPWLDSITGWLTANPSWLGVAIFLVACFECLAIAGLIVPGTVIMFAVAVLAGSGALSLGETLLLGFAGGLAGDILSYFLGRRFHQNIRRLPGLRHHPEWIGRAELYFQRYGIASLLVGRFIGPLRPMLPMVAGMFDMPFLRFAAVSLIAAAGWSVVYLLPGWATGAAIRLPLPEGFWPQAGIVGAGLAVLLGFSIHASVGGKRYATTWISALSLVMLIGLFIGWPYLAHFDQGLMTLVQEHRSAAADPFAVMITRLGDFRTQAVIAALLLGLLLVLRQWRQATFALGVILGSALVNTFVKWAAARARPEVLLDPLTSYSMPSGHSSGAFAIFMALAVLAGRGQPLRFRLTWLLVGSIPALSIAMSRVYLGVHWPTDVLAGAMLAFCMCAASLTLVQRKEPLQAMPTKVWWVILPSLVAVYGFFALHALANAISRYQY